MFSAGAGVFFAGAGGEKPGVCTALYSSSASSSSNGNQRSQRDDSRIQKEPNKANDFTCKL